MKKYGTMIYEWSVSEGRVFSALHGEPTEKSEGEVAGYVVNTTDKESGSFIAPFEGSHGWYWKNDGTSPVTVTLKTQGYYEIIGTK